jgi:hypothetical protein
VRQRGFGRVGYAFLAVSLLLSAAYVYGTYEGMDLALFSRVFWPFEAFAALGMSALALRAGRRIGPATVRVFASYSLGMMFWFVAESVWSLGFFTTIPYFPSLADLFWLIGYVPLLAAMLLLVWPFRKIFVSSKLATVAFGLCAVAGAAVLFVGFRAMFMGSIDFSVLNVTSLLFDVVLLLVALPVLLFFWYWGPMRLVLYGIIVMVVADAFYTLPSGALIGAFNSPFWLYDASYLVLILGFYVTQKSITATMPGLKRGEPAEQPAKFCINCRAKIPLDSKVCSKCGSAQQ